MLRALILALALLASPAAAQPAADDSRRALLDTLRRVGVEVGAVWPIGELIYQVEEIKIERSRSGEVTISVRTKLLK